MDRRVKIALGVLGVALLGCGAGKGDFFARTAAMESSGFVPRSAR